MSLGRGKLVECVKSVVAVMSQKFQTAATVTWNGLTATVGSAVGIDTRGYENVIFNANVGAMTGAQGVSTVSIAVYENDTDNAVASTAITGATFTDITYGANSAIQSGAIVTRDRKRYLFARVNVQGACSPTLDLGITAVLGKGSDMPPSDTIVFDV